VQLPAGESRSAERRGTRGAAWQGSLPLSAELFQNDKIVATATATAVIRKM
jgi:hypothetical protein